MPGGPAVTILDGGMGRQLSRMGAPFRLPEWSALALIEAPQFVSDAHDAFIASGAQIITTNSYANAFSPEPGTDEPYAGISELREDLGPGRYVEWAAQWVRSGATILGGCCGIGPEHIAALRAHFR
jgi:S-methylmethionine-dependent homocysteine/selenocysteine methylase